MNKRIASGTLHGIVQLPPSKSDGQRAVLCAALAQGKSVIHNLGPSADEQAMVRSIRQMGAKVESEEGNLRVTGIEKFPENLILNCGESGLGLRLLAGICAAHPGEFTLTGEGSILKRDHSFFTGHFPQWGGACTLNGGKLPLHISAPIKPGNWIADGSASSQYVSGLLMAMPLLREECTLKIEQLTSYPYVQMTLQTMKAFGVDLQQICDDQYALTFPQTYRPCVYQVEGDWSAASYWLVAAALGHPVKLAGLKNDSFQADKAMLEALNRAGCEVVWSEGELGVQSKKLYPFEFDATHCPDLFPALVTLAAFCPGISILRGVHRLANKESDRGLVLKEEFGKLGLRINLDGDEMHVYGGSSLKPAQVSSYNDHRIAMCLAIAARQIEGGLEIEGAEAVAKSYPNFWEDLSALHSNAR